jgi:hypothetical protein
MSVACAPRKILASAPQARRRRAGRDLERVRNFFLAETFDLEQHERRAKILRHLPEHGVESLPRSAGSQERLGVGASPFPVVEIRHAVLGAPPAGAVLTARNEPGGSEQERSLPTRLDVGEARGGDEHHALGSVVRVGGRKAKPP